MPLVSRYYIGRAGNLGTGFNDGGSSGGTTNLYLFGLAHILKNQGGGEDERA
jgi:hypothetical protein